MSQPEIPSVHEERFYRFRLDRSVESLQTAIEDAIGVELTTLAYGMWTAKIEVDRWNELEITVRALAADDGTTVEVDLRHHARPLAVAMIPLVILSVPLVIPFVWMIAESQRQGREQAQARRVLFHKIWTEIGAALGAAKRRSYREARVRVVHEEDESELSPIASAEERRERSS